MFHTNTNNQSCDGNGNALGAGLLVTASATTTATTTSSTSPSHKYARLWRRTITVGVIVSLKKTTCFPGQDLLPSPTSSSPLLVNQQNDSDSLQQESSNTDSAVPENGFIHVVSKACNSFSRRSFKDQGASSSSTSYAPVPTSSVEQGLCRNLSTQSRHAIDIPSEIVEEEKSEDQICPDLLDRIVKARNLNLLKAIGGPEKVASAFGSHLEHGIQGVQLPQPQIWNTIKPNHAREFLFFLLKASNNFNILLLLVAAALSFVTGTIEQGPKDGWHDGAAILIAVFVLLTFPAVTNFRRARKLEKKQWEEKNKLEVKVVRSGREQLIAISNLLEGDVVRLAKGDRVPGDGLVVNSDGLMLDDVLNSEIDPDQNPFLFSGSKVMEGHGTMLLISVGGNIASGQVLRSVSQDPNEKTLLEAQTEKPNAYMESLSLAVTVLIALVALIRLLWRKHSGDDHELPELKGNVSVGTVMKIFERFLLKPQGKISILVSALTVVAIAVQHGMPFVITVSLFFWNEKLLINHHAKPQNLSAGATMGIASVICIDVTGGLVCNRVDVSKFCIGEKDVNNDVASEINQAVLQALERGIGASVLVPEISLWPTTDWLVSWAKSRSLNVESVDQNLFVRQYRKLSPNSKVCGVLMKINGGEEDKIMHMHWSGTASTILNMCSYYYDSEGRSFEIKAEKRRFQKLIKDMEESGLRPIAFACGQTEVSEIKENGLHLLALAGLREEIKSTVEALRNAGVRIILVSEDELLAVTEVACELGNFRPESNDIALEGEQFRELNSTERMAKLDSMTLMGSCLAADKLLLVQSAKEKGHVVAFFGGSSTRDTPALKEADVGITEENKCTEMARECSDIVISAVGSLLPILKLGRCAYCNIQKFTKLQLTGCTSGLLITLVTTLILEESPITSIQLIWVYCIMYILGGLMMRIEFKDQEPVTNPPARRTKSLLDEVMWKHIAVQVLCQVVVLLIFQFAGQVIPSMNRDIRKAMTFNSFTLCQVFNQFDAMRLLKKAMLPVVLKKFNFLVVFVIVIAAQVLVVEFATSLAGYQRLNGMQWGICFILAALPWGIHRAVNFIADSFLDWSLSGILRLEFSRRQQHRPYVSFLSIPFSMFLYISISHYYNPDNSFTFR